MNKNDWTILFVRLLGLYLVAIHIATFATTAATLAIVLTQGPKGVPINYSVWQAPTVSLLILVIGIFLIAKAPAINAILQRSAPR